MITLKLSPAPGSPELDRAAEILNCGGLVAVPTETVYGLAANGLDESAVRRIYEVKGRPETKPISLLVSGMEMALGFTRQVPAAAHRLAACFWPGPLTMVLWAAESVSETVRAGGKTVGVRCPDHELTLELIEKCGHPLAAPSANLSGQQSPKNAAAVAESFEGLIDCIIDGGECSLGIESTIVDLTVTPPQILREGGLSRRQIEQALEDVEMKTIGITGPTGSGKTTALNVLREFGALIIDCDAVYHELLESSEELREAIVERFGDVTKDGRIDRKRLGEIVFSDPQELEALNAITGRFMHLAVERLTSEHRAAGGRVAAIDAIALIESGLGLDCDVIVGILAPKLVRAQRIVDREGISMEYAIKRIEAQQADEFYRENCDVILENNGTLEEFEARCRTYFEYYLEKGNEINE